MKTTLLSIFLLFFTCSFAQKRLTLSGFIKDKGSKELLIGASIAIPKYKTGTTSNAYGFYSISLPADTFEVVVSYVGFMPKAFRVDLRTDVELNIELEQFKALGEVVVKGERQTSRLAESTRMSVIEIPISQIKDIPALFGEKDVLKVIQLLPGVQKPSEGNSGIYVRGGGPDQNLIILDEATVYNAFHLFGFFSLFNGDALKSVELTKGGFPARYGGRLSSVIDMSMKEGNKTRFSGEAGIGVIASRFLLEGPLVKNKASFLVSARRTYLDVLTRPFMTAQNKVGYFFYDLNAKVNWEINQKNRVYLSGYFGRDKFKFISSYGSDRSEGGISWGNATGTARWNHLYNNKTFSNTSFIFSDYKFGIYETDEYNNNKFELSYRSGIRDYALKHDIDYRPNTNHSIRMGVHFIYHQFTPSAYVLKDQYSGLDTSLKNMTSSYENAVYIEDDIKIGTKFRVNPGLRISNFIVQDQNYINPEPRINASYNIKSDLAVKASYAIMNQYVHLLSNTGIGLPTDLWVPSSNRIKPQRSWQVAGGVAKDFIEKNFSVSVEGYYKEMSNIISYKEGASFLEIDGGETNDPYSYEKNITSGKGWSYGAEFLLQRKVGKITGWVGYTLSWTQWQFDELNFGEKFWARYDRRHDISVVGIYKIREQQDGKNGFTLSATWVYGTGNAITLPIADYNAPVHSPSGNNLNNYYSGTVSQYTSRNAFRMAPYHRMDIGLQVTKKMEWWVRTWEFSIYNVYNRLNPYFYYTATQQYTGNVVLRQITLFPFIPSISWNIKF
jgi:outer membrane receptor for ferrienterochelin and colicin